MEHPSLELLRGRAYPELARALRAGLEVVIKVWQEQVHETLSSADEMTFTQIRDDMPKVLEQVAKALESDRPFATRKLEEITPIHGETRFHQGFRLEELLTEYCILRPIIIDEVTARLARPMEAGEVAALMTGMDVVPRQTPLEYVPQQPRQLQAANEAQSKYLSFL